MPIEVEPEEGPAAVTRLIEAQHREAASTFARFDGDALLGVTARTA